MSAELVVKKRGRPKKVVQEAEIEIPDSMKKKTTTRAKSTKTIAATATAKPTKAGKTKVITSAKTITASPATSKTVVASKNAKVTKTIAKIEAPTTVNHPEKPPKTASATATRSTPITTTTKTVTSKISSPTLSKAFEPQEKPTIIAPATAVDENTTEAHQVLEKAAPVTSKIAELKPTADTKAFSELSTTIPTIDSAQKPAASSTCASREDGEQISTSTSTNPATTPQITTETSKILKEVRELSQKNPSSLFENPSSTESATSTLHTPASAPATRSVPAVATISTSIKEIPRMSPPSNSKPPPNAKPKPIPKPHIPIAGLNKEIVSNITARAGARPRPAGNSGLPPSYNNVARKVTMAIVAAPIAIVTSYVLYQRLVLKEEQKYLVQPESRLPQTVSFESSSSSAD
ncbi:hypothetical protein GLAREA_02654 [Glarea lozoyensis ATCC 20868]|uniref:Uncharacterized protein n=1 Tax=Glarea lozoyensis (strain ATCC 20868 / MF5171) TaxID=1116229 RepID=S3CM14_GLAL2|nr:uncharacterized protein GLAREA_02654 [Glarea lozoyensis ATCC 20868]EPE26740.1 hypothetical protein GLAREA_02654 [Glarea lozoyensis ATCC 20868]